METSCYLILKLCYELFSEFLTKTAYRIKYLAANKFTLSLVLMALFFFKRIYICKLIFLRELSTVIFCLANYCLYLPWQFKKYFLFFCDYNSFSKSAKFYCCISIIGAFKEKSFATTSKRALHIKNIPENTSYNIQNAFKSSSKVICVEWFSSAKNNAQKIIVPPEPFKEILLQINM